MSDRTNPRTHCAPLSANNNLKHLDHDALKLAEMGYIPSLKRNYTIFSILGAGFSLTNSWFAISAALVTGINSGGPLLIVYGIILICLISICVGISLSELASAFPNAGGQYFWTNELAPKRWANFASYLTGWIAWAGSIFTSASVALAVGSGVVGVIESWHVVVAYQVTNLFAFVFNCYARSLPTIAHISFYTSLIAFMVILISVPAKAPTHQTAQFVFANFVNNTGWSANGIATFERSRLNEKCEAFIVGLINTNWAFTCLDCATHLAEEVSQPERTVPMAIMGTVTIGFVTAWFYAIALFFSMDNLDELFHTDTLVPILELFFQALGNKAGAIVLESLVIATGVWCLVTSHTWQCRLGWSFARDNGLPGSRYMSKVDGRLDVPICAHAVSCVIVAVIGLLYLGSSTAFNSMVTACIVLLYISYAIPITPGPVPSLAESDAKNDLRSTLQKVPAPPAEKFAIKATLPKKSAVTRKGRIKATRTEERATPVLKPKQTKSRDGCQTCKLKRLKCDETKPSCLNCERRGVQCGGYHKVLQWRSHEKATFDVTHAPSHRKKRSSVTICPNPPVGSPNDTSPPPIPSFDSQKPLQFSNAPVDPYCAHATLTVYDSPFEPDLSPQSPIQFSHFRTLSTGEPGLRGTYRSQDDEVLETTPCERISLRPWHFLPEETPQHDDFVGSSKSLTVHSPVIVDETTSNLTVKTPSHGPSLPPCAFTDVDGGVEKMIREANDGCEWQVGYRSPCPSTSSSSSGGSYTGDLSGINLQPEHSGLLHWIFDQHTCGILSIKDGPGENPWRTLIWPMAISEPALYYAIMSLTACHAAKQDANLRVIGGEMQSLSMRLLRERIYAMRTDAAVATTLVLAFSESWLSHIHTGILHLRGARQFILQGLQEQESACLDNQDMVRVRFLRSTWVYMDIIARLTATGEDSEDLDSIAMPVCGPDVMVHDIDPLMGCATTLFPYIGAVANLVRHVRRTPSNSRRIVSRAAGLKYMITKWRAPVAFQTPEDESLETDHSRHTAEAYRWATLLYLCQAVPMICSEEPAVIAERTLDHLAAVPITSRSVIIHIFPLLAAGCEAVSEEDRSFVEERWVAMMTRMCIGNIDRCWDVVKEVWNRRDAAAVGRSSSSGNAQLSTLQYPMRSDDLGTYDLSDVSTTESKQRTLPSTITPIPTVSNTDGMSNRSTGVNIKINPEMTVRGGLHWVAVMTERKWESEYYSSIPNESILMAYSTAWMTRSFYDDLTTDTTAI
ncbi:MAG: hypothetical protein Q9163_004980 [Psora crenata]